MAPSSAEGKEWRAMSVGMHQCVSVSAPIVTLLGCIRSRSLYFVFLGVCSWLLKRVPTNTGVVCRIIGLAEIPTFVAEIAPLYDRILTFASRRCGLNNRGWTLLSSNSQHLRCGREPHPLLVGIPRACLLGPKHVRIQNTSVTIGALRIPTTYTSVELSFG